MRKQALFLALTYCGLTVAFFLSVNQIVAQTPFLRTFNPGNKTFAITADVFGTRQSFIKNVGQYGDVLKNYSAMGKIHYAYEGFGMPVLFTQKGLVHLQRKLVGPSKIEREEKEERERKHKNAEEEIEGQEAIDKLITVEWLNANPNVQVIAEEQ